MINTIIMLFSCARQSPTETAETKTSIQDTSAENTGELYSNVRYEAGPGTVAVEVTESADNAPALPGEFDDEAYQAPHIYQNAP